MGLLSEGSPLTWDETKALAQHVREHGIEQFINLFARLKDRQGDVLKWGDEVEYIIVRFDDKQRAVQVSLRAQEILAKLNEKEAADPQGKQKSTKNGGKMMMDEVIVADAFVSAPPKPNHVECCIEVGRRRQKQ